MSRACRVRKKTEDVRAHVRYEMCTCVRCVRAQTRLYRFTDMIIAQARTGAHKLDQFHGHSAASDL